MSRIAEYRKCAAMGMGKSETARALGVANSSVRWAAERYGIEFVDKRASSSSERLKELWNDPAFREARANSARQNLRAIRADGCAVPRHLRALTPEERTAYDAARKVGCFKNEALNSIGRPDLVKAAE